VSSKNHETPRISLNASVIVSVLRADILIRHLHTTVFYVPVPLCDDCLKCTLNKDILWHILRHGRDLRLHNAHGRATAE
jgi:hypothetical protein